MRKRTLVATLGATGVLALAGVGVAIADPTPDPSDPSSSSTSAERGGHRAAVERALGALVEDGTLTPEQADRVTDALADSALLHRDGGHGPGWLSPADLDRAWEAAAQSLRLDVEDLRAALAEEGTSLADVAAEQGVATEQLVEDLVAAAGAWIEERVSDGSLSRERADALLERLPGWVTAGVEDDRWSGWALRGGPGMPGPGWHHGGPGDRWGHGGD